MQLDGRIAELYGDVDPAQCLLAVPGLGGFLVAAITGVIGDRSTQILSVGEKDVFLVENAV